MDTEQQRFSDMKRRVYKIALPVLAFSLGLSHFLTVHEGWLLTLNLILLVGMLFAWLLLSTKLHLRVIEWFLLTLAVIYLLAMVIRGIYTQCWGKGLSRSVISSSGCRSSPCRCFSSLTACPR